MEESISAGAMVICINIYNDICGIHTIGKCQFNAAKLRQYIEIARSLVKPLVNAIRESLDKPKSIIAK
jgi:exosome complex RNA-binding protein Rrp42 (RNase PH superfamily)